MQHILVATDLSERAAKALRCGLRLALRFGARLTVLHVVDADQPLNIRDEALHRSRAWLEQEMAARPADGVEVSVEVIPGTPDATVIEIAERDAADLVVMGAHRRHLLRDVFVGTTIERVIRGTALPVLLVNREPEAAYGKALVAVDFSDTSERALSVAAGLSFLEAEEVVLLHAFQSVDRAVLAAGGADPKLIEAHAIKTAGEALGTLRRMADRHAATDASAVTLRTLLEEGPAVAVIERVVSHEAIPLVVMGSRGHSGVLRWLLGSTAESYLRTTTTADVLVVSPARAAETDEDEPPAQM